LKPIFDFPISTFDFRSPQAAIANRPSTSGQPLDAEQSRVEPRLSSA